MAKEAIDVARSQDKETIVTLSTGVRAVLTPVASTLIQDVMNKVKDPKPPMWHDPVKEQEVPNFNHPDYIEAVEEATRKRSDAALDAVLLFGVELVDEAPDEGDWLDKLRYMERRGHIDLSDYDLTDKFERDFVYKRYVAMAGEDFNLISELSGVPQGERARARNTFPDNEEWGAPGPAPAEEERSD